MLRNSNKNMKLVILGESKENVQETETSLQGADFQISKSSINGKKTEFGCWYVPANINPLLLPVHFNDADGVIVVFDLTDTESFAKLDGTLGCIPKNTRRFLVGTHCVQDSQSVTSELATEFAQANDLTYFETDAKKISDDKEIFKFIIEEILSNQDLQAPQANPSKPQSRSSAMFNAGFASTLFYGIGAAVFITVLAMSPWILVGLIIPLAVMGYGYYSRNKQAEIKKVDGETVLLSTQATLTTRLLSEQESQFESGMELVDVTPESPLWQTPESLVVVSSDWDAVDRDTLGKKME